MCPPPRGVLNQTGTGHFSPIGGYNSSLDMVLIMDVARFKYPPHWVPLPLLHEAMQALDPDAQKPRGLLEVSAVAEGDLQKRMLTCCCTGGGAGAGACAGVRIESNSSCQQVVGAACANTSAASSANINDSTSSTTESLHKK
jgi:hypothetical protein